MGFNLNQKILNFMADNNSLFHFFSRKRSRATDISSETNDREVAIFEDSFSGIENKRSLLTKANGKSFDAYIKTKTNRRNKLGPDKIIFKETFRCTPTNRDSHNGHKFCKYTAA